jgi:heme/copper-type cytochrome/quinol oxidase subunit 2
MLVIPSVYVPFSGLSNTNIAFRFQALDVILSVNIRNFGIKLNV